MISKKLKSTSVTKIFNFYNRNRPDFPQYTAQYLKRKLGHLKKNVVIICKATYERSIIDAINANFITKLYKKDQRKIKFLQNHIDWWIFNKQTEKDIWNHKLNGKILILNPSSELSSFITLTI